MLLLAEEECADELRVEMKNPSMMLVRLCVSVLVVCGSARTGASSPGIPLGLVLAPGFLPVIFSVRSNLSYILIRSNLSYDHFGANLVIFLLHSNISYILSTEQS